VGKKGGQQQKVYDYLASLQYGICHGPIDAIYRVRIGGKIAWLGDVVNSRTIRLNNTELFGGTKGSGGIYGDMDVTMGRWNEVASTPLAARLDLPLAEIPAYRGFASVFFRGTAGVTVSDRIPSFAANYLTQFASLFGGTSENATGDSAGFYWGQNVVTIPPADVTVSYCPPGPAGGGAWRVIWPDDDDQTHDSGISGEDYEENEEQPLYPGENGLTKLPGANPAYMIYEAIISEDYGSGIPVAGIHAASFLTAAEQLHTEKFGMSMIWTAQMKVKDYVQEILNTIRAFLFVDPDSGLWTMRLLRDDNAFFDGSRTINPSNADVRNRKRMLWGETANRIIVQYTDPTTEEMSTVESTNLANIAIQNGRVRPETKEYKAVRWPQLAQVLADRDLAELSLALFSAQVRGDRNFASVKPGDTFVLQWPEDGIVAMIVRVMKVDPGGPDSTEVRFDVVEDLFSSATNAYRAPQAGLAVQTTALPAPLTVSIPVTIPMPIMTSTTGLTVAALDALWPSLPIGFIVDHASLPVEEVRVYGPVPQPNATSPSQQIATVDTFRSRQITSDWVPEVFSTLTEAEGSALGAETTSPGRVLMLGDTDAVSELVMLYTFAAGEWTVLRGLYDTVPQAWPTGTRISAFPDFAEDFDPQDRVAAVLIPYRFQPVVGGRSLTLSSVPTVNFTPTDRPILPFRPANVQLDGAGFNGVDYSEEVSPPATYAVTWANRNRTREDQVPLAWNAAGVTHEAGTTTTVRIINFDGTLEHEETGLTGESLTLNLVDFGPSQSGWIEVLTERDGYESRAAVRRQFTFVNTGWGNGWGFAWGQVR